MATNVHFHYLDRDIYVKLNFAWINGLKVAGYCCASWLSVHYLKLMTLEYYGIQRSFPAEWSLLSPCSSLSLKSVSCRMRDHFFFFYSWVLNLCSKIKRLCLHSKANCKCIFEKTRELHLSLFERGANFPSEIIILWYKIHKKCISYHFSITICFR